MQKWPMINFYTLSPHRNWLDRLRKTWAEEACMLFTAVSRPSSQWFCLVQPPKHSCLKSVPKHEWKRSSHTQSVSVFRRGVTALSSQISFLCFLGFCFPSGHDTFSVPTGHLFPIFGAELKRYLSCNSCVPTQRCTSFALGIALHANVNKRRCRCSSDWLFLLLLILNAVFEICAVVLLLICFFLSVSFLRVLWFQMINFIQSSHMG